MEDIFILAHCSSGFKHSLNEVLSDEQVQHRMKNSTVTRESVTLNSFFHMLSSDANRVCYGYSSVLKALEAGGIAELLVCDKLFRSKNFEIRKRYVDLTQKVEQEGATTHIFSSAHPSGERLQGMTGVAAILRFPIEGLDEVEEQDGNSSSSEDEFGIDEEEKNADGPLGSFDQEQLELLLGMEGGSDEEGGASGKAAKGRKKKFGSDEEEEEEGEEEEEKVSEGEDEGEKHAKVDFF